MINRKIEYDNLKGILIYLVVLGHLLFSFRYANTELAMKIVAFIYFFHMPLFFIVSGYFSKFNITPKNIIKLVLLFILMNVSFTIFDYYLVGTFNLFIFKYSSWYILILLLYRLILRNNSIKKFINKNVELVLVISIIISLIIGFFKINLFILRIFENWIYFIFGYLTAENKKLNVVNKVKINKLVLLFIVMFLFSIIFIIITEYSFNINLYLGESYTRPKDFIIRFIIIICNITLYITTIKLLPKKELPIITQIGKNSLYIYSSSDTNFDKSRDNNA